MFDGEVVSTGVCELFVEPAPEEVFGGGVLSAAAVLFDRFPSDCTRGLVCSLAEDEAGCSPAAGLELALPDAGALLVVFRSVGARVRSVSDPGAGDEAFPSVFGVADPFREGEEAADSLVRESLVSTWLKLLPLSVSESVVPRICATFSGDSSPCCSFS